MWWRARKLLAIMRRRRARTLRCSRATLHAGNRRDIAG
jgi:hypothetical protein